MISDFLIHYKFNLKKISSCLLLLIFYIISDKAIAETEKNYASNAKLNIEKAIEIDTNWSVYERWAWKQIINGEVVNFNSRDFYKTIDKNKSKKEKPVSSLSSSFLETILLKKEFSDLISRKGVRIIGAAFEKRLDLSHSDIACEVWLDQCIFNSDVDFSFAKFNNSISMENSTFQGKVFLNGLSINGQLNLSESTFDEDLSMDSLKVNSHLFMSELTAKFINLRNAFIEGELDSRSSQVTYLYIMDNIKIGENLALSGSKIEDLDLHNALINGHLDLSDATVFKNINLVSANIKKSLLMKNADIRTGMIMTGANVNDDIDLSGSDFKNILLMDSVTINRNLFLSRSNNISRFCNVILSDSIVIGSIYLVDPEYCEDAKLNLRYAKVGLIIDSENAWPADIDINNFIYSGFSSPLNNSIKTAQDRKINWYIEWLKKNQNFSIQPYSQLSKKLIEQGRANDANKILFISRRIQHSKTSEVLSWLWQSLQLIFIGYGYKIFYCLYWFLGFLLIGAFVLNKSGQGKENNMPFGFSYSFDMLLPFIKLREYHYKNVELKGWVKYYFYFHQLMGYILASFLIAGLSGLAK